jgi:hypothetical protein
VFFYRLDYYGLLKIDKTAGENEIKKAYFKASKEFHPDRHANAEEAEKEEVSAKFKQAKEAYETLRDAEKKKQYDSGAVKPPPGGWYQVRCSECSAVWSLQLNPTRMLTRRYSKMFTPAAACVAGAASCEAGGADPSSEAPSTSEASSRAASRCAGG